MHTIKLPVPLYTVQLGLWIHQPVTWDFSLLILPYNELSILAVSLKIHILFFSYRKDTSQTSRCLVSEEKVKKLYCLINYYVLFSLVVLLLPHLEDIQPWYMYNYWTLDYPLSFPLIKVTCGSSQQSQGTLETLNVLPQLFSVTSHLPVQTFFLMSSLGNMAVLPDLDSPSFPPPPSICAGTWGRWLGVLRASGGCPILSWWEQRQSISLALTGWFKGPWARPDRQVQPVTQPPMYLSLQVGKTPQKYVQLLHP